MNTTLVAGGLAGVAGLLAFLVIHHVWILPIWFILPIVVVVAAAGGLVAGWAYRELLPHLPARPWTSLVVMVLNWAVLLPAILLAELRRPLFDVSGEEAMLAISVGRAALIFMLELLLTATVSGALAGWLIGRSGRAALATAVAGLVFALGPGHNIPLIGGTPGVGKEMVLMATIIAVSTLVLVEGNAWLLRLERGSSLCDVMEGNPTMNECNATE